MHEPDAPAPRIIIRDMTAEDVRRVRRIESAAYEDSWPARTFEEELTNAFAQYRVAVEPLVEHHGPLAAVRRTLRRDHERVLGFMGCWYMVDQLHLVTIAVDPARQSEGIGRALLLDFFDQAFQAELDSAVLEVRVSNTRARRLYEEFGFRRLGTLHAYYKDNDEDAYVMQADDLRGDEAHERIERLRREHRRHFGARFHGPPAGISTAAD